MITCDLRIILKTPSIKLVEWNICAEGFRVLMLSATHYFSYDFMAFFLRPIFFGIPINWLWPIFECRLFSIHFMRFLSHFHHQRWNLEIINHPFMYYTNHHGIGSKERSPSNKKSASVHFTNFRSYADFLQQNLAAFMHPPHMK